MECFLKSVWSMLINLDETVRDRALTFYPQTVCILNTETKGSDHCSAFLPASSADLEETHGRSVCSCLDFFGKAIGNT